MYFRVMVSAIRRPLLLASLLITPLFGGIPACAQEPGFAAWQQSRPDVQRRILALARQAFNAYVTHRETIAPPRPLPSFFTSRVGVFVSCMRYGSPRCCMGTLYPTQPNAAEEIIASAVAAAGQDRRFPPIKPAELSGLTLIVSIVSAPHPITVAGISRLDPARDGLVVQYKDRCGVILSGETSQVARMVNWGRIRAGAGPADPVQYFRIESVRFVEPSPGGEKTP